MKFCDKEYEHSCHCETAKRSSSLRVPPFFGGTKQSQYGILIVAFAIIIKLSLFTFAQIHAPQSKLMPDSVDYLRLGTMLATKSVFALPEGDNALKYEIMRTPGYPAFMALFHEILKIPYGGVILLQILMTLLVAFIVYKTAILFDEKIAFLSMVIILFDPPITIFSLMLLTETLFLLLISVFMLCFMYYIKNKKYKYVVLSALILATTTYVRPIAYYLGFVIAAFIVYIVGREDIKRALLHALVFILIVYSFLGVWQIRNYIHFHDAAFSSSGKLNLASHGIFHSYNHTWNRDPYTKGYAPLPYYVSVSIRCVMSLFTRPGNLKYFQSDILTVTGKILAYPCMVFWLVGFISGIVKMGRHICIQFMFVVVLYFMITSIGGVMWIVGERYRIPMMPFIAIISAYGWSIIPQLSILIKHPFKYSG